MTTTPEQRAEWKGLAEKATPGPWLDFHRDMIGAFDGHRELTVLQFWTQPNPTDRAFVLASRTALPALISHVEALKAEILAIVQREAETVKACFALEAENARLREALRRIEHECIIRQPATAVQTVSDAHAIARAAMGESE